MHHCGIAVRCQRLLNSLPSTLFGKKSFSDKVAPVRVRRKPKRKIDKLASFINTMDSETSMMKEPVNQLRESKLTNFVNEKASKLIESQKVDVNLKLYIAGSGAIGAPKSLYLKTSNQGYLFNCGEDIQKSSHVGLKLGRVRHIFITNLVWGNVGGFPGLAKLLYEINANKKSKFVLKIHGPLGLKQLHDVLRSLIYLKDQEIQFIDNTKEEWFDDGILKIKSIPLYPLDKALVAEDAVFVRNEEISEKEANSNVDTIIENFLSYDYFGFPIKNQTKLKLQVNDLKLLMKDDCRKKKPSICYICKSRKGLDRLSLEACVDRDVPASLLWKLKQGEDIQLPNGEVVRLADVTISSAPEATLGIVDCPEEAYLDSLLEDPSFKELQSGTGTENATILIAHFSPPPVMNHPKYVNWMKSFSASTKHLRINEENICIGNVLNHSLQTKLNLLHEEIFPKLPNPSIPVVSLYEYFQVHKDFDFSNTTDMLIYKIERRLREMENRMKWEPLANLENILEGRSKMIIDLKTGSLGSDTSFVLCPEQYVQEALEENEAVEALKILKEELKEMEANINSTTEGDYPKFLFLGTGSGAPTNLRSASGIIIFTNEDSCMLLDCGEGTYNRLNILFGKEKADEILLKLKAVYISHLHSDHHFGLIQIIKGRRRAIDNFLSKKNFRELPEFKNLSKSEIVSKLNIKPIYLLAPYRLSDWLTFYDLFYENIQSDFNFISNAVFDAMSSTKMLGYSTYTKEGHVKKFVSPELVASFLEDVGLIEFRTCLVKHCFSSFGVSFKTNNEYKVSYSGDCEPSGYFIQLGADSDFLIHEATFENSLSTLAANKKHSTVGEALFVAKRMKAKFTLLTHFSQRYRYIPLNTETFSDNIGVAFDFMMVSMKQLPLLPKFLPVMRVIFKEDLQKNAEKTIKMKLNDLRKIEDLI